jgi:TRAP-type mannitol/chloroaromatic compound transport system permease small subunit
MKKAHFLIIRIKIKDEPVVSFFLKLLFLLPFPLFIIRVIINFMPKKVLSDAPIEKEDLKTMLTAKGVLIDIHSKDGDHIYMKTI